MSAYSELVATGCLIDSHESDLYVLYSQQAVDILDANGMSFSTFRSQIDGNVWIDVAFAYEPFWDDRAKVAK